MGARLLNWFSCIDSSIANMDRRTEAQKQVPSRPAPPRLSIGKANPSARLDRQIIYFSNGQQESIAMPIETLFYWFVHI